MQKTAFSFIWNYLKKFKFTLFIIITIALVARGISQTAVLYMAKMFDWASSGVGSPQYWSLLLGLLVLCVGLEVF